MIKDLNSVTADIKDSEYLFEPILIRLDSPADKKILDDLLFENKVSHVSDRIYDQLKELIKSRNPGFQLDPLDYEIQIKSLLNGIDITEYGAWVYYPWSAILVHILDEDEFIELRTTRNREKITWEEQQILKSKKIGIVGLSVGQSIALTLAMERTCGELRLADYDTLDLSNLNRLRTGIQNIGLKKTIIAAREIAEIDPFLKVKIYNEGLTESNMDSFFNDGEILDLLVEVCDSLKVKVTSRLKARELQIPVVMDTNDRGMLDIERFDLEPNRNLFHGLIEEFLNDQGLVEIDQSNSHLLLKSLVSFDSLSERMKYSMSQINKTITSWPQLASSVVLGGAITTDVSRRILLGQHKKSGRYYVDLDQLIN